MLGNTRRDELDSVTSTPKFRRLADGVEDGIARCRQSCSYFGICGGGSPSNKLAEHGSFRSTETLHCRLTRKAVADVVLDGMETVLGLPSPRPASTARSL